jgi:hypothetical protein
MLDAFIEWGSQIKIKLAQRGFDVTLTSSDKSSNSSARLDVDTANAIARITFWSSGNVDLEAINIASEEVIYSKQLMLSSPIQFDAEFHDFFAVIGINF